MPSNKPVPNRLLLLVLSGTSSGGCLPAWDVYNERLEYLTDGDGDGQSEQHGDCDDRDPDRYDGAAETCNERDDDCDGDIDEGPVGENITWYPDNDRDGYGADGSEAVSCTAPGEGYTLEGGDCDDSDPAANPSAIELCNGQDDDCNGLIDEDSAADAPTWYKDVDGDGFGGDSPTTLQCEAPDGYAAEGGDCDDTDEQVSPAAPEQCNGEDDDCDGVADDPPLEGPTPYLADHDGDGFGDETATDGRCAEEAGFVELGGDCNDDDNSTYPGAPELCNDGADNEAAHPAAPSSFRAPCPMGSSTTPMPTWSSRVTARRIRTSRRSSTLET